MKAHKTLVLLILWSIVIFAFHSCDQQTREKHITISGAFALYPLTVKWAEEYQKLHPDVSIDVSAGGAGKGMTDVLSGMVDLAMFSRTVSTEEIKKGAWPVSVARDAVVPVFNSSNPNSELILKQGITKEQFTDIYVNKKNYSWNDIFAAAKSEKINVYTRSDACGAAEMWAKFLGSNQESLSGTGVFGDPGIADAVKNDKFGIGYNNIAYAYDIVSRKPFEGIQVLPLDQNANGGIDENENFYATLDQFMKAISENQYPSPPARDLYLISKEKPLKAATLGFLNWVLTDGQKFIHEAGYIQLNPEIVNQEIVKLSK